jgi:transposase-like protein
VGRGSQGTPTKQIAFALRQAEGGTSVTDVCRTLGISEATFYVWGKKDGNSGATELRELRQQREENANLWGQENDFQRTRAAGFDHHLLKPIDVRTTEKLLQATAT